MSPGSCLLEAGRGPEDSLLFPSASYYVESDRQPFLGVLKILPCERNRAMGVKLAGFLATRPLKLLEQEQVI